MAPEVRDGRKKRRSLSNREASMWQGGWPWPVKVLTLLLLAQGVALILIGLFNVDLSAGLQAVFESNSFFATLPALGLVALLAGVGFFSLRPGAWVMAMLVQGLVLLVALAFYFLFQARNLLLYGMMAYSVMMVIYLNYAEVPAVFRVQPALLSEREEENVG